MKVIIFGATGMIGQAILCQCLIDSEITEIQTIGRTPTKIQEPKIHELIHQDLYNYEGLEDKLSGFDACFFCLGTTSAGKVEAEYEHITYDLTLSAATILSELNPQMTFIYISADGADTTEKSTIMWAKIRGKIENVLFRLPFKAVYIFRPGIIQPKHGIQSKTKAYRLFYSLAKPILPILRFLLPNYVATTESIGRAMLLVAKHGYENKILKSRDFEKIFNHYK